jgi:hypothetical protein
MAPSGAGSWVWAPVIRTLSVSERTSAPGSGSPTLAVRSTPLKLGNPVYAPAATGTLVRAVPRNAGITCLPNNSSDCSTFSCGIDSVCMISST